MYLWSLTYSQMFKSLWNLSFLPHQCLATCYVHSWTSVYFCAVFWFIFKTRKSLLFLIWLIYFRLTLLILSLEEKPMCKGWMSAVNLSIIASICCKSISIFVFATCIFNVTLSTLLKMCFIQTHVVPVRRVFTCWTWLPVELWMCWHCLNSHRCLSTICLSSMSPSPCMPWIAWFPLNTIPVLRLVHPHDVVLCHWAFGRSQDHSGALMAEEFKACLISLGYDVENNKQVGAPGQDRGKASVLVRPRSRRAERRSLPVYNP